jgi:YidC/Oxa1 family membrane protein insertase
MRQMREMAKLKPEMDKLKERFGDDKNGLNQAVMELYKKHGVNPLGGCLPMLIQMPIYIALYSMLGNSVELYRASFGLWWHDLTAPDPYFVLPITSGILMFVQQWLSPTNPTTDDKGRPIPWYKRSPADPQQRMMMFTMPAMFTAMTIFLPAGLSLYILTNTLLGMLQQFMTNKGGPALKPAKA